MPTSQSNQPRRTLLPGGSADTNWLGRRLDDGRGTGRRGRLAAVRL